MEQNLQEIYLLFKENGTFYGFELPCVHEIIPLPKLTSMAKMPPGVAGFLNFKEKIICIVNLSEMLGYPTKPYSLNDYIIILQNDSVLFGILVSEITDIKLLTKDPALQPNNKESHVLPLVSHLARLNTEIVFILDPNLIYQKIASIIPEENFSYDLFSKKSAPLNLSLEDEAILRERTQLIAKKLTEPKEKKVTPLLVIKLNQEFFALDCANIKEFKLLEDFTPLPNGSVSPHLKGFVNLHGGILCLIDLCQILKAQKQEIGHYAHVLVVEYNDIMLGIIVDEVLDVILVTEEDFHPTPIPSTQSTINVFRSQVPAEFIDKTIIYNDKVLGLISMVKVIETVLYPN